MDEETDGITEGTGPEEQQSKPRKFFVPSKYMGDMKCEPGDSIEMEVSGVDEDGDYEVMPSRVRKGRPKKSMGEDLKGELDGALMTSGTPKNPASGPSTAGY